MSSGDLREILGLLTSTTNLTVKLRVAETLEQVSHLISSCSDEKLQFQLLEATGNLIVRPSSEIPETRLHAIKAILAMASDDSVASHVLAALLSANSKCPTAELISVLLEDAVAPLRIHRCSWKGCTVGGHSKYVPGLQRCSQCKAAYYCCPGCARLDWSAGHKAVCKAIAAHKTVNPKSALIEPDIAYAAAALLCNISRNETACGKLAQHLGVIAEAACLLAREGDRFAPVAACLADTVMNAAQDSLCRKALVKRPVGVVPDVPSMPVADLVKEGKNNAKRKSKDKKESVVNDDDAGSAVLHSPLFYVVEVLAKSANEQLRKAAYGTVRNICFENHLQENVLKKEGADVNVMTFLLSKLRGTKELSEDDKDAMSPALHTPRKMEPSLECRKLILDALLLLACHRPSREVLITDMAYPILRDYHIIEEDEEAKDKISTIVDILARDSTGNGKCPIAKPIPRQQEPQVPKEEEEEEEEKKKSGPQIEMLDEDNDEVATVKSGKDYKIQKQKEEEERRKKEEAAEAEAVAAAAADLEEI